MNTTTNGLIQFKNISSFNQFSSSCSLACFPSQDLSFRNGLKIKRKTRSLSLNTKCQVVDEIGSRASSLSALELLKTSAADRYPKESSSVLVIGINFQTTPVEIRERLSIPEALWPQAISELCGLHHIDEAAILSTCNRMEIYVVALSQHCGVKEVTEWMSKKSGVPMSDLSASVFAL